MAFCHRDNDQGFTFTLGGFKGGLDPCALNNLIRPVPESFPADDNTLNPPLTANSDNN